MYTITMQGGTRPIPIYDPRDERLCVQSAVIEYEVNTAGTATLVIPYAHKNYSGIFAIFTNKEPRIVEFYDDNDCIFKGRITTREVDFNLTSTITVTGLMADLENVVRIPYDYSDNSKWNNVTGNKVKWLFNHLIINQYNSKKSQFIADIGELYNYIPFAIDTNKFTIGSNGKRIYRKSDEYSNLWEVAERDFFGSDLGGYLYPNYNYTYNGNSYIGVCYEKNFSQQSTQKIELGKNLLDVIRTDDISEMVTAVYPLGKYGSEDYVIIHGKSGQSYPDEPEQGSTVDSDNNIVFYAGSLYNKALIRHYGVREVPYIVEDCADTEVVDVLIPKACAFLESQQPKRTINVTGFDLGLTNAQIAKIKPFTQVQAVSAPHGINDWFNLTKMTLDIINPQSTAIQLTATTAE